MLKHITSIWNRYNRNNINNAIDHVNMLGKTIQDLVAEGQLTPAQYAELIAVINGLMKSGEISLSDLSEELKKEIEDATLNLSKKADITYVDDELDKKAYVAYVDKITRLAPVNTNNISKGINDFYQTLDEGETIKFPSGEYDLYDPLIFDRNISIDFTGVKFNYYGSGYAITLGSEDYTIEPGKITLPDIYKNGAINWTMDIDGVRILNVYNTSVYFGDVEKFRKGIVIDAINNKGTSYNDFYFKRVVNNLHSLVLTSNLNGWTNENTFNSGRFGMSSDVSSLVTENNTHVLIEYNDYSQNNNMFNNVSFESAVNNDNGHAVIIEHGRMIYFRDCRYEGLKKVKILNGVDIQFTNGFGSENLVFTDRQPRTLDNQHEYSINKRNPIKIRQSYTVNSNILELFSPSNVNPVIEFKGDGGIESLGSIYAEEGFSWFSKGENNIKKFITGTSSPIGEVIANGGSYYSNRSNAQLYRKRFGNNTTSGWIKFLDNHNGSSTGRPTNPDVGDQYFDTTLGHPIWFNGTVWVDAQGTEIV